MTRSNRKRLLVFRAGAILCGIGLLFTLELMLGLLGWGEISLTTDPFVGFSDVQPLFELDDSATSFRTAKAKLTFFQHDEFAARKSDKEFRIFCLGGSTVLGRPYANETSFTTWMELGLSAAEPERVWNVVNCGGVSYASYRLILLLEEVIRYEPDLILVYTGHNEFLEDRSYTHITSRSAPTRLMYRTAFRLRTFRVMQQLSQRLRGDELAKTTKTQLADKVHALLDYRGGLEKYHHDPQWRSGVMRHYEFNLTRMVQIASDASIPIVFVNPVSNERDTPPFKALNGKLTKEQKDQWNKLYEQARSHFGTSMSAALDTFQQAARIDGSHAGLQFTIAKCLDELGRYDEARVGYLEAKDLDVCPLRMLEPMHASLIRICDHAGVPLVDVRQAIRLRSANEIIGSDWLVDHVHPSVRGHQIIAKLLVQQLEKLGIVTTGPNWRALCDAKFARHLESLSDHYFLKGEERLRALRGWAAGRSEMAPP